MPGRRLAASGCSTILLGLVLFIVTASAQTLNFPALSGRVVDNANILDATAKAALTAVSADLESRTTDQLVIATVKSLDGTSVEDYGNRLFRNWALGQKGKNNGVLLLVAPNERKVRIEVGYGLEGTLTDALSKLIIESSILPRFRANDYPDGIKRGADAIVKILTGDVASYVNDAATYTQRSAPPQRRQSTGLDFLSWVLSNFGLIIAMLIIFGGLHLLHVLFVALGLAQKKPTSGFWYNLDHSSGSSGSSSWSGSSSSGDGGGFSGGGGSSGGGGASGSW